MTSRLVPAAAPTTVQTRRLRLRPPTLQDRDFHRALHSDPATYAHAPWAISTDPTAHLVALQTWVEGWQDLGVHYWLVEDRESGRPLGFAGVRVADGGMANLYYRLTPQAHGAGLGREAVRAAVAWAAEWLPTHQVRAVARDTNAASQRTAEAAGLVRGEPHEIPSDPPQVGPSRAFWLPRTTVVRGADHAPTSALRDQMLDLWCAVNAAGGSVGFTRDSPREQVAALLDDTLASTDDEVRTLAVLRDHEERLLGFGWWIRREGRLFRHTATLKRFMVDPAWQGRNLGRVALAGLHAVARDLPGLETLDLTYRSGSGLGRFYASMGWVEVGRVPRAIRVGEQDYRDSVWMVRGNDARAVIPEGSL
ncbi:GNAT family N-acetyltransferase [Arsenicicoccus dermatophilus]|uniref:GNAT family N-acetyltransferase n=1 Tax=Arsenicicoccus dermatophilus TaxID=1076331 RepID=UPI003917029C